jgi:hypothetical protein
MRRLLAPRLIVLLVGAALLGGAVVGGCSVESGPDINPQPIPPGPNDEGEAVGGGAESPAAPSRDGGVGGEEDAEADAETDAADAHDGAREGGGGGRTDAGRDRGDGG